MLSVKHHIRIFYINFDYSCVEKLAKQCIHKDTYKKKLYFLLSHFFFQLVRVDLSVFGRFLMEA